MHHDLLMLLTANMPMKVIQVNDQDYLERYYVNTDLDGTQHWLHRFLRSDSERHLHSHPWEAESTILCGWYREQYPDMEVLRKQGDVNHINPDTLHRIVDVKPDTWTYMKVYPGRSDNWFFIGDDGAKTPMRTSEPEWWKAYPCRGGV